MSKNDEKLAIQNLDRTIRDLKKVREDLLLAYEVQWSRPRSASDPDDPGIRSRGGHSDPTGDAAVDASRLSLRDAVKATEKESAALAQVSYRMVARMASGLRRYSGD